MSSQNMLPWLYKLIIDYINAVWKNAEAWAATTRRIIEGDIKPIPLSQGANLIPSIGDNPVLSMDQLSIQDQWNSMQLNADPAQVL